MTATVLSDRALNRALLARQSLVERTDRTASDTVVALVGMQAQAPLAPYVGLWSRMRQFDPMELAELVQSRALVRATLHRGTVHLVTAEDALSMRPLIEPTIVRSFRGSFGSRIGPERLEQVLALGRELLDEAPRTRVELREVFRERWPDEDLDAMTYAVSYLLPTVQATPRGVWGHRGSAQLALMTTWLDRSLEVGSAIDALVLRYLAAFGPASVKDAQAWSGLTGLREVIDRLGPQLRSFVSEHGQELFDLPEAPRPGADLDVPPRLLPEYDNVLLSHHDRRRIIDDGRRVPLPPGSGARAGTFLVDGLFRGTWAVDGGAIQLQPYADLVSPDALIEEAGRLATFLGVGDVELRPAG